MPTFRFVARFQGISLLPEDVYENTLFYDCDGSGPALEGIADNVIDAFDTWGDHGGVASAEMRVYPLTEGQPILQKAYTYDYDGVSSGPGEVAICLSYATITNWNATTARRRGRIYLGPLRGGMMSGPRPASTALDNVLELGQNLYAAPIAFGGSWQLYSPTDGVTEDIASISVDDAWDTQRRRGLAPSQRTVQTVPA